MYPIPVYNRRIIFYTKMLIIIKFYCFKHAVRLKNVKIVFFMMRKSVVTKNKERDMADELDQSTKEERAGCVHNAIAYHDVTDVPDSKGAPNVGLKGKCNLLRKEGGR